MDKAVEARQLAGIRARVDALAGADWQLCAAGDDMQVDACAAGERITIATFTGTSTPDEREAMARALDDLRFLLRLVDRAMAALRPPRPAGRERTESRAPRNHAAEAAMLCERPATKERAAQKLRSLLRVTSRAEINTDEAVRERWIALRRDFYVKHGRGQG